MEGSPGFENFRNKVAERRKKTNVGHVDQLENTVQQASLTDTGGGKEF